MFLGGQYKHCSSAPPLPKLHLITEYCFVHVLNIVIIQTSSSPSTTTPSQKPYCDIQVRYQHPKCGTLYLYISSAHTAVTHEISYTIFA